MKLEIALHCYNFQHRLNWMLSSLLQQELSNHQIEIHIAHSTNNGTPTTESIIDFFKDRGMRITSDIMTEENISKRGLSRNNRVEHTISDWILFADCDMVYHPLFFQDLCSKLENDFKNETRVIGADRYSLDIPFCTNYFNKNPLLQPTNILQVYDLVSKWPLYYIANGRRAAGYFQLVNTKILKSKTKVYSHRSHRDNIFSAKYSSDIHFRHIMGGRTRIPTLPQYHLNHSRYTKEQR